MGDGLQSERASFLTHLMLGGSLIQQPSSEHRPHHCGIYRFHSAEVGVKVVGARGVLMVSVSAGQNIFPPLCDAFGGTAGCTYESRWERVEIFRMISHTWLETNHWGVNFSPTRPRTAAPHVCCHVCICPREDIQRMQMLSLGIFFANS